MVGSETIIGWAIVVVITAIGWWRASVSTARKRGEELGSIKETLNLMHESLNKACETIDKRIDDVVDETHRIEDGAHSRMTRIEDRLNGHMGGSKSSRRRKDASE